MGRRTTEHVTLLNNLTGIREVGEDYVDRIDEVHGLYDYEATSLQRIPGKVLATTGMTHPIRTLAELKFQGRNIFVKRSGPIIEAERDWPELPGIVPFVLPSDSPAGSSYDPPYQQAKPPSYFFAPDWPTSDSNRPPEAEPEAEPRHGPRRTRPREQEENASIWAVPNSLIFDEVNGGADWAYFKWVDLHKDRGSFGAQEVLCLQIDWNVEWLRIHHHGTFARMGTISPQNNVRRGNQITTLWEHGLGETNIFQVYLGYFLTEVLNDGRGAGVTDEWPLSGSGTITITAMDRWANRSLTNPDGSGISATIDVQVIRNIGMKFVVGVPGGIPRGDTFNLTIRSVVAATGATDTTYVPIGNVLITDNHPNDNISPVFTDNSGWVNGQKTVQCQITGGSGDTTVTVVATDPNSDRVGSDSLRVYGSPPASCPGHPPLLNTYQIALGSGKLTDNGPPGSIDYGWHSGTIATCPVVSPCFWRVIDTLDPMADRRAEIRLIAGVWELEMRVNYYGRGCVVNARKTWGATPVGSYTVYNRVSSHPAWQTNTLDSMAVG